MEYSDGEISKLKPSSGSKRSTAEPLQLVGCQPRCLPAASGKGIQNKVFGAASSVSAALFSIAQCFGNLYAAS
jgi:hypothetical protein